MADIADQIASVSDDPPFLTMAGNLIKGTSWALVRDRVTVKIVKTNASDKHPFQGMEGVPDKPVPAGSQVPETGYAVVNVTGHEAFTRPGVPCDQWGNMHPSHGSHF